MCQGEEGMGLVRIQPFTATAEPTEEWHYQVRPCWAGTGQRRAGATGASGSLRAELWSCDSVGTLVSGQKEAKLKGVENWDDS